MTSLSQPSTHACLQVDKSGDDTSLVFRQLAKTSDNLASVCYAAVNDVDVNKLSGPMKQADLGVEFSAFLNNGKRVFGCGKQAVSAIAGFLFCFIII